MTAQGPRHRTAWVFGREDNCLTSDEVALCSHFCAIPTSTVMPTLNLSHAVAVVLSRLYCDGVSETSGADDSVETKINKTPLTLGEFEALMKHWEEVAVALDLTRGGDPEKMMIRLRRLLQRARPNVQEAANLRRFLSKVQLKTKKGDDR
ncbi:MAG: hypothetical protein ACD_62C00121G0003 [uncultured bacterium]|nr:MAG: hypothetical protein ACD_62C00121G0003 [uncultured bacterium]